MTSPTYNFSQATATASGKRDILMHIFIQFLTERNMLTQWMDDTIDQHAPDIINPDASPSSQRTFEMTRDQQLYNVTQRMRANSRSMIMLNLAWAETGYSHMYSSMNRAWEEIYDQLILILEPKRSGWDVSSISNLTF